MAVKRGLGKGLDALFSDSEAEAGVSGPVTLELNEIEPNHGQPRKDFDLESLNQLADSIKQNGVLQPLLVRPIVDGGYQLIAGERRWRAARIAGVKKVPVVVREMDDEQVMAVALIENLQREDLNPIEEAEGFRTLMDKFGLTQEQVAEKMGKSRPAVANSLRLLSLPDAVLNMVKNGDLSQGHARALLQLGNSEAIESLAQEIVKKGMTVRAVEKAARAADKEKSPSSGRSAGKLDMIEDEIARVLSSRFGRKVTVKSGKKKGIIEIEYYGSDDLKSFARQIDGAYRKDGEY